MTGRKMLENAHAPTNKVFNFFPQKQALLTTSELGIVTAPPPPSPTISSRTMLHIFIGASQIFSTANSVKRFLNFSDMSTIFELSLLSSSDAPFDDAIPFLFLQTCVW
jgi:hypothetical protein